MGFQKFDRYSWGLGYSIFGILGFLCAGVGSLGYWLVGSVYRVERGLFVLDTVAFYLGLLSIFLGLSLIYSVGYLRLVSKGMLLLSVVRSILCYCCVHALWFWVFYEMSILPLLLLLILESPYSERYIASWYLLGYVVLTRLPMLLCVMYGSSVCGRFYMQT